MKKRFVISTNIATAQQNEAFKAFLNANNLGWWHWLVTTWLIIDWRGQWNAHSLRDAVRQIYPGLFCLVIEVPPWDWAGFGPASAPRDMFQWIRDYWDK